MKNKVFISGSISINELAQEVKQSIKKITENNIEILIGDAKGVDTLLQEYCLLLNYYNITIYSISKIPRYKASEKFNTKYINISSDIKKERERQKEKDKAMTIDSEFTFTIWDGKSKGSYANILRALTLNKKIKIYLNNQKQFLSQTKINENEIEFIFRENNGYTASEIVQYLNNEGIDFFQKTQNLNKYLMQQSIIEKDNKVYKPMKNYNHLFIVEKYRGTIKGIKFRNEFIAWIEKKLQKEKIPKQQSLF